MATVSDTGCLQQNESSEAQQMRNAQSQQTLNQRVQDSVGEAADPRAWNRKPQELSVSYIETTGKDSLYQDQTLPNGLSTILAASGGEIAGRQISDAVASPQSNRGDAGRATIDNFTTGQLPSFEHDVQYLNQDINNLIRDLQGMTGGDANAAAAFSLDRQLAALDVESMHQVMSGSNPSDTFSDTTGPGTQIQSGSETGGSDTTIATPAAPGSNAGGDSTAVATPAAPGSSAGGDSTAVATPAAPGSDAGGDSTAVATPAAPGSDTSPGGPIQDGAMFSIKNGEIIGPNGQPFIAKGINVNANGAAQVASQIRSDFPGLNMIRLNANMSESAQQVQTQIDAFTSAGIVVEVEDHSTDASNNNNVLTGQALTNEEQWYSQIAAANANNPNVWFGTANEPTGDTQSVINQEVGIYDAIRATGNNNMVMLELGSGNYLAPIQQNASAFENMTNVAWDGHFYGWEANQDTSQPAVDSSLQAMIQGAESIQTGEGAAPIIIGEYGNSGTGYTMDNNGNQVIGAVQNSGVGSLAWQWNQTPSDVDSLTDGGGNLTAYGQELATYINGTLGA